MQRAESPAAPVAVGVDYGTASGRVLLLDLLEGEELASVTVDYPHGVIDRRLPSSGEPLPPDWALQDPGDYLHVLEAGVPAALAAGGVDPRRVVGLGVDVTSCTVLPATADGTPLCRLEAWSAHPHAWPKLWKHHAAQPVADTMNAVAAERGEAFLARYGGRVSSEWYFPKLIEVFEGDRPVYDAMAVFVEATDWIVWQLTGALSRSACPAGYKALWSPDEGLPPAGYFSAVSTGFDRPGEKLGSSFHPLGSRAGELGGELAGALGLEGQRVAVAVGNVDSFVSVPGCGVAEPGVLVSVVGTSICDMLLDDSEVLLPGVTGVVRDGIVPGRYGYEAGQAAVGDMLAWYLERLLAPLDGPASATGPAATTGALAASLAIPAGRAAFSGSRYGTLEAAAAALSPGSTGLVALDWWNGNRSVLADADLGGVIAGLGLQSSPAELYRALLESVAFGARTILDNFAAHALPVASIVACGGIAEKSELMMQLLADVTGRSVAVPGSSQVPARGAALFGAVAAGRARGGFADVLSAAQRLHPGVARRFEPDPSASAVYDEVYRVYRGLHDMLGITHASWLHTLKDIRRRAAARPL